MATVGEMQQFQPRLLTGEHIVYVTGHHWLYIARAVLPLIGAFLLGAVSWSLFQSRFIALICLLLFVLAVIWLVMKIFDTVIIRAFVTNQRLIYRKGWTQRNTIDVTLDRIGGVFIDQNAWGRFFSYGKVKVIVPVIDITLPHFLRNPIDFRRALYMKKPEEAPKREPEHEEEIAPPVEDRDELFAPLATAGAGVGAFGAPIFRVAEEEDEEDHPFGGTFGEDVGISGGEEISVDITAEDEDEDEDYQAGFEPGDDEDDDGSFDPGSDDEGN
jgi:hypothetical protein